VEGLALAGDLQQAFVEHPAQDVGRRPRLDRLAQAIEF
jgi:hypothetical protein